MLEKNIDLKKKVDDTSGSCSIVKDTLDSDTNYFH
jgi:hypothetical protein